MWLMFELPVHTGVKLTFYFQLRQDKNVQQSFSARMNHISKVCMCDHALYRL